METYFYRNQLPHWQPPGATFFITYRLAGSIPQKLIAHWKLRLHEELKQNDLSIELRDRLSNLPHHAASDLKYLEDDQRFFTLAEQYLEQLSRGPFWLQNAEIAQITADALAYYDGQHYTLWGYCIMSNHVHVLLTMQDEAPILWKVLQSIKRHSARQSNRILNRLGAFWHRESYDHVVRQGAFFPILRYILDNPVKARMVKSWEDYPWSYCHPSFLTGS